MDRRIGHHLIEHAFLEQANQPVKGLAVHGVNRLKRRKNLAAEFRVLDFLQALDHCRNLGKDVLPLLVGAKADQRLRLADGCRGHIHLLFPPARPII